MSQATRPLITQAPGTALKSSSGGFLFFLKLILPPDGYRCENL